MRRYWKITMRVLIVGFSTSLNVKRVVWISLAGVEGAQSQKSVAYGILGEAKIVDC